ncbi:BTAD domain-containing putative transcriptional regulator [Streptomyces sp. SAJ15]|uniref:AfsR/SARP family transcriptional regulator n=1 Tax=Streptomyces sp. SAJ15 TaxID=2011095 RepID=UPI0016424264|nr:BTAD domain-containing putative transcriptional regulator [Streptomyces sp. SAJ15]
MRFQVLGNFEVLTSTQTRATPSAPKLRRALALLILRHGEVVPTKALIDELWGSNPPDKAVRAVHTYVYELRRSLARGQDHGRDPESDGSFLETRPGGYLIRVPDEAVDVSAFRSLVREGGDALAAGDPGRASATLARALGLWRGGALANVECGELLEAHAAELEESRLRALEMRIEADFQLRRHQELTGELKALARSRPLHEGIHAKLMLALYRSGRRSEALKVFQDLRGQLVDELGLEPGPELQRLQRSMLIASPTLDPPPAGAPAARRAAPPPAQLPRDTADFTGRRQLLGELGGLLATGSGRAGPPVVSLVGMPGTGKTATAVHLAHAVRHRYPDGQIYVPLGGSQRAPGAACAACGRHGPAGAADGWEQILRGIGIPAAEAPATVGERMALFRTWSAERRVLLVLDDAASAAQVEPLLPGGSACGVLVTSRSLLYGLRAERVVRLGCLSVRDGVRLLARIIGRERTDAEPQAAAEVVRIVDGLPLAITFIGERLMATRPIRVSWVAAQLRTAKGQRRMADLASVGLDLYDRLEACFDRLDGDTQTAFLRLALAPRRMLTAAQGARTLGLDPAAADMVLMRLADASLVELADDGADTQRHYRFRGLVREYALERIGAPEVSADADAAPLADSRAGSATGAVAEEGTGGAC